MWVPHPIAPVEVCFLEVIFCIEEMVARMSHRIRSNDSMLRTLMTVVLCFCIGYIVSVGPVTGIHWSWSSTQMWQNVLDTIYAPLWWSARVFHVENVLTAWVQLWAPTVVMTEPVRVKSVP